MICWVRQLAISCTSCDREEACLLISDFLCPHSSCKVRNFARAGNKKDDIVVELSAATDYNRIGSRQHIHAKLSQSDLNGVRAFETSMGSCERIHAPNAKKAAKKNSKIKG